MSFICNVWRFFELKNALPNCLSVLSSFFVAILVRSNRIQLFENTLCRKYSERIVQIQRLKYVRYSISSLSRGSFDEDS